MRRRRQSPSWGELSSSSGAAIKFLFWSRVKSQKSSKPPPADTTLGTTTSRRKTDHASRRGRRHEEGPEGAAGLVGLVVAAETRGEDRISPIEKRLGLSALARQRDLESGGAAGLSATPRAPRGTSWSQDLREIDVDSQAGRA